MFLGVIMLALAIQLVNAQTETLFTVEVPSTSASDRRYELGTEFQVLSDGYILKARLYSHANEGGDHDIRLWRYNGSTYVLAAGPYTWNFSSGVAGWKEYDLPAPFAVNANTRYIISISNSTDQFYVKTPSFIPVTVNQYITYIRGLFSTNLGSVPYRVSSSGCYFRDIVFALSDEGGGLTAGSIGNPQTICHNTAPAALTQLTAPTGGTGTYTYQWQSSPDNSAWTDIGGATAESYSPPALTANTYYRRTVSSEGFTPVQSNIVLITVSPQITLAQLNGTATIDNNTSANFNVVITGGTSPFTVNYTRNGVAQPAVNNYVNGSNISTGVLTTGVYTYVLTSVTDAPGCSAQSLGTEIVITVTENNPPGNQTETLFTVEVPSTSASDKRYELGTEFQVLSDGYILKARLYSHANEGGDHDIRLWRYNGSTYVLAAGPYTWNFSSGVAGWKEYDLPAPFAVNANTRYIISISNSTDQFYVKTPSFIPVTVNQYITYMRGLFSTNLGSVPYRVSSSSCYFRDIVFALSDEGGGLTAGSIGNPQTICHNTAPAALTQLTAPTGGTGTYTYQWQSSPDNSAWTDIGGATAESYSPPALTANTYYRRTVSSEGFTPVQSNIVLITVSPQITLAQLNGTATIDNNTSANFNVVITGGTSPFTVNYTRNGVAQPAVNNYVNGSNISTGVLTTGVYTYVLTSVTDAPGCSAQSLGTEIVITVTENNPPGNQTETLFTVEVPSTSASDKRYELGTEFQVLSDGYILKARLYSHANEGGDHDIRLWRYNGSTYVLAAGPYTWNFSSGVAGWKEYDLPAPFAVNANTRYIISISNSTDQFYVKTPSFIPVTVNQYITYMRGLFSTNLGSVPYRVSSSSCYFRDIVFALSDEGGGLTAGSIGNPQTICYNTSPAALTQLTAPTGGMGTYTYQWQSSPDNSIWTDITGASLSEYTPEPLITSTYFRLKVSSGSFNSTYTNSVLITVFTYAQLFESKTIYNNTSTTFDVIVSEGTPPYTVNYSLNGVAQPVLNNYFSGTDIPTGILTTGSYTYSLTSVTDASGCTAHDLGSSIIITVSEDQNIIVNKNKALVAVNSTSANYSDYLNYIKPYFDNFGIPYDVVNVSTTGLPELNDYAIIILSHKNVYSTTYPIAQLEAAVAGGVGLYSFDPHLFDFPSEFNTLITNQSVNSNQVNISDYTHYITKNHTPDTWNPTNDQVTLLSSVTVVQRSNLVNGTDLVSFGITGQSVPLMQIANFGNGRIVRWNGYDWVFDNILGPVYGMDDLLWRGIVWSARKPFIMQGMPPFITMRVDDAEGRSATLTNNFEWIKICNEFEIIPWIGTFNDRILPEHIPTLKSLLDNNLATASPHAFTNTSFIYFNHNNLSSFDPAANTRAARDFYTQNGLKMSKYLVPHYYEHSSAALAEIQNMGIEFLATHMLPDNPYYGSSWINNGPFRTNRNGRASADKPVYYADYNTYSGMTFFNCLTEIRDDGGYEWYPDSDEFNTSARGIRHLRRSLNSMVLSSLFTHENYFDSMSISNLRTILQNITSSISVYNPEYTSTDYAVQYIRAKNNIRITNVVETISNIEITYNGINDMTTKCYLFTGQDNQITYTFVSLPQTNGVNTVTVLK